MNTETDLESSIFFIEQNGVPFLGTFVETVKDKNTIFLQTNEKISLPKSRLFVIGTKSETSLTLSALLQKAEEQSKEISVETLWKELLESFEPEKNIPFETILTKANQQNNIEARLSLRLALIKSRLYFARTNHDFTCRSLESAEKLIHQEKVRQEKEKSLEGIINYIQEKYKNPATEKPSGIDFHIKSLIKLAAATEDVEPGAIKDALMVLDKLKNLNLAHDAREAAYQILIKIGEITKNTNLFFIRHGIATTHSDDELIEGKKLVEEDLTFESFRKDLTHFDCFTVDDSSTCDMDDAISFTKEGDNTFTIGIHISDIASIVKIGTVLDTIAKKRSTSVYAPDKTVNLLPEEISEDLGSLVKDKKRKVISYLFKLNAGNEILGVDITPAIIIVKNKYTYEELDSFLVNQKSPFAELHNLAASLEEKRIQNGAFKIDRKDINLSVSKDGNITASIYDESSAARLVIGEMMVLANTISANYCLQHSIPVPFRGQPSAELPADTILSKIPEGPARDYVLRGCMKKSTVSTRAHKHAGIGAAAYVQVTSPIRRYLDLVTQRQILAHLTEQPLPYSKNDIEELIKNSADPLDRANLTSRESKRFWLLRYLESKIISKEKFNAVVVKIDGRKPVVHLPDFGMNLPLDMTSARHLKPAPGLQVTVCFDSIDPRRDFTRLKLIA